MTAVVTSGEASETVACERPLQINFPGFNIGADDTVVDIGCGAGVVCRHAGFMGADVVGIEIEPDWLARADGAMRDVPARSWRGIVSDCDPIPLPDATATVVVCTEVLEHVADPARLASELARIGRPGARYLISVPDPASERLLASVAPDWYWKPPYHSRIFEHDQLDDLLGEAGLMILGRHATGFSWAMWWLLTMMEQPEVNQPPPASDATRAWEGFWAAFSQHPRGEWVSSALDATLPKSQMVLARKPDRPRSRVAHRLRRFLRDGGLKLGGIDIRWQVRRSANSWRGMP